MSRYFNTLIVEDEPGPLETLLRELEPYKEIVNVSVIARSYAEALHTILINKFDLSILDINLGEGYTCFDLIQNSNVQNFGVIAINSNKSDIPTNSLSLFKSLPTYISKPYTNRNVADFIKRLNEIEVDSEEEFVNLNTGHQGIIPVKKDSIAYIEAKDGCSIYYLLSPYDGRTKLTISGTLIEQEGELKSKRFFRVHKSFIVNLSKIIKFEKGDTRTSGKLKLEGDYYADYSKDNYDRIIAAKNLVE